VKYEPWVLHLTLVHFPIAFFLGAIALDLYAWYRADPERARVATGLLWAGLATAALTALAGVLAMFTGPASHTEESGNLVWWHIGAAVTQFLVLTLVAFVHWRAQPAAPPAWSRVAGLLVNAVLVFAGYLGDYIVYHGAAGIEPDLLAPELRSKQEHKQGADRADRSPAARLPSVAGAVLVGTRPARAPPVGIAPKPASDWRGTTRGHSPGARGRPTAAERACDDG
jgi:uncharacterized membrane protein